MFGRASDENQTTWFVTRHVERKSICNHFFQYWTKYRFMSSYPKMLFTLFLGFYLRWQKDRSGSPWAASRSVCLSVCNTLVWSCWWDNNKHFFSFTPFFLFPWPNTSQVWSSKIRRLADSMWFRNLDRRIFTFWELWNVRPGLFCGWLTGRLLPATRQTLSQFWSLKIRLTTFLSYIKFADLLILRL